eukprot:TRINITY_DN5402_c0_g1_i1.p1 TRINITY_DN5402_c0_g1~~TRINITY_DN5402_c0_g1_i1.p1  ORF type:complete len:680 (-),score=106.01 TRINITY_DN5402_c0_g1_i1:202-2241(-)
MAPLWRVAPLPSILLVAGLVPFQPCVAPAVASNATGLIIKDDAVTEASHKEINEDVDLRLEVQRLRDELAAMKTAEAPRRSVPRAEGSSSSSGRRPIIHQLLRLLGQEGHEEGNRGKECENDPLHGVDEHGVQITFDHENVHLVANKNVIAGSLSLMVSFLACHWLHQAHIDWLPESVVIVSIGTAVGLTLRLVSGATSESHTKEMEELFGLMNQVILNLIMLPPIIFESGWSLRLKDFLSQFGYILIFAVFGTLISTGVIAYGIYWTQELHHIKTHRAAFTFASLISAVDPVATLATYSSLKVEPLLNIMVFGESTINDAVAIALFTAGNEVKQGAKIEWLQIVGVILWLLFGSLVLGVASGWLLSQMIRRTGLRESPSFGVSIIGMTSWCIYVLAEGLCSLSGIIASLFCGISMAVYLKPFLESKTEALASYQLKQQAVMADTCIFLLVGIAFALLGTPHNLTFSCLVAGLCLVGRAVAVYPLGLIVNAVKRYRGGTQGFTPEQCNQLSWRHLTMMWHAGLRGGIAMALVMTMTNAGSEEAKEELEGATSFVIFSFLILFGGSTNFALNKLNIPVGVDAPQDVLVKKANLRRPGPRRSLSFSQRALDRSFSIVDRGMHQVVQDVMDELSANGEDEAETAARSRASIESSRFGGRRATAEQAAEALEQTPATELPSMP